MYWSAAIIFIPTAVVNTVAISCPVLQSYWDRMSAERQAAFLEQIALRRLPRPEELTSAVLFLCSEESRNMTGQCLTVDGGWDV